MTNKRGMDGRSDCQCGGGNGGWGVATPLADLDNVHDQLAECFVGCC